MRRGIGLFLHCDCRTSVMLSESGRADPTVSLHEICRSLVREAMGIVVCTALNSSGTSKLQKGCACTQTSAQTY